MQELLNHDLSLHPRQGGPKAEVDTVAEREVAVAGGGALDVEALRVLELTGVAVRGDDQLKYGLSTTDLLATDDCVAYNFSLIRMKRGVAAQRLFDRVGNKFRTLAKPLKVST